MPKKELGIIIEERAIFLEGPGSIITVKWLRPGRILLSQ